METLQETITTPLLRSEQQRRAWRNALARRRLERIREEKVLNQFLTEVWDDQESTVSIDH